MILKSGLPSTIRGHRMSRLAFLVVLGLLFPSVALAQRDPPLTECYLTSITARHAEGDRIALDLVLKKETGATEHREHQMYLLAYLQEDEAEVLKICADEALLDKRAEGDSKLFLDVLLEKRLVTILETKTAPRQGFAGQDVTGKYSDGFKAGRDKADFLKLNTFDYSFELPYHDLFEKVATLKHFRPEEVPPGTLNFYKRKFKILAFAPVNDSKYASKVSKNIRGKPDFGLGHDLSTPILYCRPLPYEFQFRRDSVVAMMVYIR
jgi:hypothetical protein